MAAKHVTKKVTLTVQQWKTLGAASAAAAGQTTNKTAAGLLRMISDMADVVVDEARK